MILTDGMLREAIDRQEIKITPFEPGQIQAATYDLRVGDEAVTTSIKEVRKLREKGYIGFEPGDFGFVTTLEKLELDAKHAGRIGLRTGFARKGLIATTGPQIDPGFRGVLIIGIMNLTPNPVSLSHGDKFVTVEFHELPSAVEKPYEGQYQDIMGLRPEDIALVTEQKGMALSEMLSTLGTLTTNVGALAHEMTMLKWVFGVGLTIMGIIIAIK